MMNDRDFARMTVDFVRGAIITPEYAAEAGRRIALSAPNDKFNFARYFAKGLLRRARRAGRKRLREPSPYMRTVAIAAVYAQWDNRQGIDKDDSANKRADEYGVPRSAVFRAAFERKDPAMNALMREIRATPEIFNQG